MVEKNVTTNLKNKPLYRSKSDRMITGLIGGLGEYLNVTPTALRLIYVVVTAFTGFFPGIVAYIIGSLIVPEQQ